MREAAVIALPHMLFLWWRHARVEAAKQPSHVEATEQPNSPVLQAVIGALLRQAADRLDRLQKVRRHVMYSLSADTMLQVGMHCVHQWHKD